MQIRVLFSLGVAQMVHSHNISADIQWKFDFNFYSTYFMTLKNKSLVIWFYICPNHCHHSALSSAPDKKG